MVKVLVEKRDGRVVDFDPINIISAVKSAFADLDKKIGPQEERLIRDIANQVEAEIKDRYNGPAKIEDIQNLVEHGLIEDHLYDVARTYTNYRLNKDIERAKATDINEAVRRLVDRDEALVRENANKDSNVYSTQRDLLAGAVSKASAFSMLPDAVSNAHMKGDIHFHDADYSPFTAQSNCSLPNYWDMLANGFTLGNAPM
ncbi:MAG: anaerobic ribonucleoside-triphosphate reductase, partial [Bifidobacterium sp.]|nr:anaerobic ribonucleoside-triphosphate reductase [Bifidobacterium sp.]